MSCDVLNLEWSSRGRDRELASMICATLRSMGHRVVEGSVFQADWLIRRHRPRLLYLADPRGAAENYRAGLRARELGIPVVTVFAEGNIDAGWSPSVFWGHVSERRPVERLALIWSARSLEAVRGIAPEMGSVARVVGAVGFDRYRILRFASREELLRDAPGEYDQIIGYSGWAFDFLDRDDVTATRLHERLGAQGLAALARDREGVTSALAEAIRSRPRTLFVLRDHPGSTLRDRNEIAPLVELPNVVRDSDRLSVSDAVSACDAWLAYESTTCLEAWLAGTPTIVIDPTGLGPVRSNLHVGSARVTGGAELTARLEALAERGEVPGFAAAAAERARLIRETIQWDDGRNHLRAAHQIDRLLAAIGQQRGSRGGPRVQARALAEGILFPIAPMLPRVGPVPKFLAARARFSRAELRSVQARYEAALATFDAEHPLTAEDLGELDRINRVGTDRA